MKPTGEKIHDVRTEDGLQNIILTTEELRRLRGLFDRAKFNKAKLIDAVRQTLMM